MTTVTATMVKDLRERTGAGIMDCKKALVATDGDIEKAIEDMRKSGQAKADKKSSRVAAEGIVTINSNSGRTIILEVNSETDFVSRDASFKAFVKQVGEHIAQSGTTDVAVLNNETMNNDQTVEDARKTIIASIGENIQIRRASTIEKSDNIGKYLHGERIGVIVALEGGDEALAKDIAMHIAASNPMVISPEDVSADIVAKEKEIFIAQAEKSGKPAEIAEKMVEGRLRKFLQEVSLTGQDFVKDPSVSIADLLKAKNATVKNFVRYMVGEGIEKEEVDFAKEVMEQATAGSLIMASPYKRVLLKLSGEILTESDNSALSESRLNFIASALKDALNSGIELAVVLGAGNIIRGATTSNNQLRRITADQMGMTATIINGLALCDLLNANGAPAHLFSAIELPGIVEKFNANRAQKLLANKTIVILCGGTGNPFVTTDSAASLRAIELDADILLKATKVDGIYSDDPKKNSNATLLKNLSYAEVLEQEYGVMDLGAFCQCRDYNMPIRVFNALKPNALEHALSGEDEGTLVGNSRSKQ